MSEQTPGGQWQEHGQEHHPNWGSAYPSPGAMPPPQYAMAPPKHPQATTAMVLGILGLVLCGILAPFAWNIGARAVREIDANPYGYSGRSEANAGKIMGIIGTVLIGISLAFVVLIVLGTLASI